MTELYDFKTPDAGDFVVAWLLPLGACWSDTPTNKTLPYKIVNVVDDEDNVDTASSVALVSVHTYASTFGEAKAKALEAHRRMSVIADNPLTDVLLPDGSIGNVAHIRTIQKPVKLDFGDTTIKRFVARYELGFAFVAVS
ncbi:hypothetical protein OF855_24475 [Mycolicibacterium fortuitum]|uniref:hypothetical protein n=1 Tax=Mycolicibacterium fortuitum TaxID=1766 RepID=UPI0022BA33DF|nr:hypothetical protein [Mycolicibacterium fortuitum]WAY18396.1 hypothetical protein OF855_24475 [Mycolicibacterium fortuitum]